MASMRTPTALLLTLLLAGPTLAGHVAHAAPPSVVEAERARLSDEMNKLVQRQVWPGAERKFQELEELGLELTIDEYVAGATAARELGDVQAAYDRLKKAAQIKGTKEIVDWLWDIDNNYGHVELVTQPSRTAELTAATQPFDPNQRKAVDTAVRIAKQDGSFTGLLPKGPYAFAGQEFTVRPGLSVRIEVSPRMRRQGLIDPVILYRDLPGAVSQPDSAGSASDSKDR